MQLNPAWLFMATAAVVGGVVVSGPPARVTQAKLDQQRVTDIVGISQALYANRDLLGVRPKTLDEVLRLPSQQDPRPRLADPASDQRYEYKSIGGFTYRLCAKFDLSSDEDARVYRPVPAAWVHGFGRHCYALDLYVTPQ
jgi:hypothetical protein